MVQKYYLFKHYKPRAVRDISAALALDLKNASESEVLKAIKSVKGFETRGEWLELYSPQRMKFKKNGGYRYFKTRDGRIYEALIGSGSIVNEQGFNASKKIIETSVENALRIIKASQSLTVEIDLTEQLKVLEEWKSINNPVLLTEKDIEKIKIWEKFVGYGK